MNTSFKIFVLRLAMVGLPLVAYLNHSNLFKFPIYGNSFYEQGFLIPKTKVTKDSITEKKGDNTQIIHVESNKKSIQNSTKKTPENEYNGPILPAINGIRYRVKKDGSLEPLEEDLIKARQKSAPRFDKKNIPKKAPVVPVDTTREGDDYG